MQAADKGAGQGVNPGTLPVPYGFLVLGAGQMAAGGMRRGDHLPRMVRRWLPMGWKHRALLQFPAPPMYVAAGYCLIEIDLFIFFPIYFPQKTPTGRNPGTRPPAEVCGIAASLGWERGGCLVFGITGGSAAPHVCASPVPLPQMPHADKHLLT